MRRSLFLISLLLLSCSACGEKMQFDGSLLYGANGIRSLEFSNGSDSAIESWQDVSIDEVSKIDGSNLLLSSYILSPSNQRSGVLIYDLESKTSKPILIGSRAVYIPRHEKIVFYDKKQDLAIADLSGSSGSIEVIDTDANAYPMSVVPVSSNEFLYESRRSGSHGIWKYNFESKEAMELPELKTCSLSNAIWRASTSHLLCSELEGGRFTGKYFLTDLVGDKKQHIGFGEGNFWPVIYIDDLDAIVLQERAASLLKGEYHPLHIYQFADGVKTKLAEDVMLSRRVVYLKDNAS